jgi:type II secretion system protein N
VPVDTLDTNLLASARKPKEAEAAPQLPVNRRQKILKVLAYCLIFIFSLVFFMILKIPDSVVTNLTMRALNQNTPYSWRADKISFRVFFLPHLEFEKLELEPKFPTGPGGGISIDKMSVFPSLLSLIPSGSAMNLRGSFTAEAYKGLFSGSFNLGASTAIGLKVSALDLTKLTPLSSAGIDLKGMLESLIVNLTLENQRLSRSDGDIRATGKNIVFDPASLQLPMAVPILDLGPADIQARIARGKLRIEKFQLGGPGKDIEARLEGEIQLSEPITYSRLDLRLRVKPSAKLTQALPSLQGMLTSLAARRADGFYGMKLSGTLGAMSLPQPDPN